MIGIENDISASTVTIGGVIAVVGWVLRGSMKLLIAALGMVTKKFAETIGRVDILDSKLETVIKAIGDVDKTKEDINRCYARLKVLENDFTQLKQ